MGGCDIIFGIDDGWKPKNAHPRNNPENLPICPSSGLLDAIGELLGIDPAEEEQFCGLFGKRVNDIGSLSGRQGVEYQSVMFCYRLADNLEATLIRIDELDQFDFEGCITQIVKHFQNFDLEMLGREVQKMLDAAKARRKLSRMMENAPLVDDPARPMTKDEVITYARNLFDALVRQVVGHERDLAQSVASKGFDGSHEPKCPNYPRGGFYGFVS